MDVQVKESRLARLLVYLAGLLTAAIVMLTAKPTSGWFAIGSGLTVGFAIPLLDTLIGNSRHLKIAWYSIRTWRGRVRISASYLYRIKVDSEYLLIRGKRFDQFQPVGGVYKTHASSSGMRDELNILDDNLLVPDAVSEGDLRVRVPGKHLLAFFRWFEGGHGRETDGWREFYEELVAPGILPREVFRVIKYDRIERRYQPMKYSLWAESQELLIADVLELLPTPEQLEALRQVKMSPNPMVMWASEKQIRRLGAMDGSTSQTTQIAQTAVWTIDAAN